MKGRRAMRASIRGGDVAPSKIQTQLVRDSSFSVNELSLLSSVQAGNTDWHESSQKIFFTDLMRIATDQEYASKMHSIANMYSKILESHVRYYHNQLSGTSTEALESQLRFLKSKIWKVKYWS